MHSDGHAFQHGTSKSKDIIPHWSPRCSQGGETHRKCSECVTQWLLDACFAESLALAG